MLAAAVVLAVALSGALTAPERPTPGPVAPRGAHLVPSLYVWPGWLLPGLRVQSGGVSAPHGEFLQITGTPGWDIDAFSPGDCALKPGRLACAGDTYQIAGSAGRINGFPAYWSGGRRLLFRRTRDQWATDSFPTHGDDLRVARHLTGHVPTAVRCAAQLTGKWPGVGVQGAAFLYTRGQAVASEYRLARGTALLSAGHVDELLNTAQIGAGPAVTKGPCGPGTAAVLDGYKVAIQQISSTSIPFERVSACDVHGVSVSVTIQGSRPFASATVIFAHLTLFGPDTAHWTTRPVG